MGSLYNKVRLFKVNYTFIYYVYLSIYNKVRLIT